MFVWTSLFVANWADWVSMKSLFEAWKGRRSSYCRVSCMCADESTLPKGHYYVLFGQRLRTETFPPQPLPLTSLITLSLKKISGFMDKYSSILQDSQKTPWPDSLIVICTNESRQDIIPKQNRKRIVFSSLESAHAVRMTRGKGHQVTHLPGAGSLEVRQI